MSRYVLTAEAQQDLRQIRDCVLDEIVYRIDKKPLSIVAILHGKRDVEKVLKGR